MDSESEIFPVISSVLQPEAVATTVANGYDIGTVRECCFLHRSINDTYLVTTENAKYILRVYRAGLRSLPEILYELELLVHLKQKGVAVALPVVKKNGNLVRAYNAPEGTRYAVLFNFVEGKLPVLNEEQAFLWGKTLASMHNACQDFYSQHNRPPLDLNYLIDLPLQHVAPLFQSRPDDWQHLTRITDRLREWVSDLDGLDWGICHGDFYHGNLLITGNNELTLLDFDSGGPGWQAFDLATVRRDTLLGKTDPQVWDLFLKGYTAFRSLHQFDLEAINLFVPIRHIWLLGLHASDVRNIGTGWLEENYFGWSLKFLREWEMM